MYVISLNGGYKMYTHIEWSFYNFLLKVYLLKIDKEKLNLKLSFKNYT